LIFGVLNGLVKPILKIITLPFVFITAGLFIFVINMFLVWFAKYILNVLQFEGVSITVSAGLFTYLYVGLTMAVVNMVIHWLVKD